MPTYINETTTTIVETFQNDDGASISIRVEPGKTIRTEYIFTNVNLTELSAEPYYNPLQSDTQTVTSTGPGDDKTIEIDLLTKMISIVNQSSVIVTAFIRAIENTPGIFCYPNTERIIEIGHNCNQLVLQFADAATVYVEERK